jgi:hypothetical protein
MRLITIRTSLFSNRMLLHNTLMVMPNKTVKSESESYVTTDCQSASLSWNKAPIWGLRPDLYYCLICWFGAPSLTRGRVCRLQLQLTLASAVIFVSESRRTRGHILLSQIRDFPFRRLLRLAGSRWRYSNPPPHGSCCEIMYTVEFCAGSIELRNVNLPIPYECIQ